MNLVLNEMHDMLRRSARDFLEQECPKSLVRFCENEPSGYAPELWGKMARQGWLSMVLPTEYGGTNSAFMDVCVLYEEMGRAIVPGPFADVVLSEYLLLDLANAEQQRRYLPGLGSGNLIATIAYTEPTASYDAHAIQLSARQEEERYVLSGAKLFVPNAHIADVLLVVARTGRYVNPQDGLTVFLVDRNAPGVEITVLDTIGSDRQCEVLFNDVTVAQSSVLGTVDNAWPALKRYLDRAKVMTSVWSVGGAYYVQEITVDYAKNRVQFGRPIGSFQAVAHKCADISILCDGMRSAAYHAAWRLGEGLPADMEIAVAKAWTAESYRKVAAMGTQIHGGVGFMMEFDIQLYFRRAKMAELLYGDAEYHKEFVAQGIGL